MDMDKPEGQGRFRIADIAAVGALLAVAVLGYLVIASPADVRSESRKTASSAPGIEGATAAGNAAAATSNSPAQQLAANAGAPVAPNQAGQAVSTEPAASVPQNSQSKPASLPTTDVAYVQKRRANIRSEPNDRGSLAGRAYKGTKLSVVSRSGKWVQVESGETKGWVSAKLIGPRLP